jgi:cytochrome c55X
MKFAAVLTPALVAALIAGAQAPAFAADDLSFDPSKANDGKKVYTSYCARCHGLNMAVSGNSFFDLRKLTREEKPRFLNSVRNGVRAMPAWGDNLKPEEYETLWSYIITTNTKK